MEEADKEEDQEHVAEPDYEAAARLPTLTATCLSFLSLWSLLRPWSTGELNQHLTQMNRKTGENDNKKELHSC